MIMTSSKVLSVGIQKNPFEKTYEMAGGSQIFNIDFLGANRQFDCLKISLAYDKSDKYNTTYDSYNVEKAAVLVRLLELESISEAYSLTNQMKNDISDKTQKHVLHKQFVASRCDSCSIAPLIDYVNNPLN